MGIMYETRSSKRQSTSLLVAEKLPKRPTTKKNKEEPVAKKEHDVKKEHVVKKEPTVQDIEDLLAEARPSCKAHHGPAYHEFQPYDVTNIQQGLLDWYDINQRVLPWRLPSPNFLKICDQAKVEKDSAIAYGHVNRAYAVWVSEIMLQQTQVVTVMDYYRRWMKRWPSVEALSRATLEEVNEAWSGLGYYSRARRLHEGAQKIMADHAGKLPATAGELLKSIPGVGPYTAGAIASIAYDEQVELLDGNVVRVLTRMRAIGCDVKVAANLNHICKTDPRSRALAKQLVPADRPGDFNQSLMELGATVCTPKNPVCASCPVSSHCRGLAEVKWHEQNNQDILIMKTSAAESKAMSSDSSCSLCGPPGDDTAGLPRITVTAYPFKGEKKKPKQETVCVCVVFQDGGEGEVQYLLVRRPETGLLAGLWEFPSCTLEGDEDKPSYTSRKKAMNSRCFNSLDLTLPGGSQRNDCGSVRHQFSHIHHTYLVESVEVPLTVEPAAIGDLKGQALKWINHGDLEAALCLYSIEDIVESAHVDSHKQDYVVWVEYARSVGLENNYNETSALSTAMRKVFKVFEDATANNGPKGSRSKGRSNKGARKPDPQQHTIDTFFKNPKKK